MTPARTTLLLLAMFASAGCTGSRPESSTGTGGMSGTGGARRVGGASGTGGGTRVDASADLRPGSDAGFDSARGAALCRDTGGIAETIGCCLADGDFPELCAGPVCDCSAADRRDVVGCTCPFGSCFSRGEGCMVQPCTPGLDQTCNGDPFSSRIQGHCLPDRTCVCGEGYTLNPANGLCRAGA